TLRALSARWVRERFQRRTEGRPIAPAASRGGGEVARTLDDLAALSGVSRATVSRVINGGPVSEETRRRVLEVLERTGYRPNRAARTLASGRSGRSEEHTSELQSRE